MISFVRKGALKWIVVALALIFVVGCSGLTTPPKTSTNPPVQNTSESQNPRQQDQTPSSNSTPANSSTSTPGNTTPAPTDSQKTLLTNIMQLAKQGKVINCEFPAKTTVIDTVAKKWGNADKTDWVPAAKGNYATYSKHAAVFGFNKGLQIFEVRTFDKQLSQLSLSKVKQVFGTPAYDVKNNGEEIIGYTAGPEFKLLLVFSEPSSTNPDPGMDHYSVLYPQGTVNSMADDPGRQW
jgi:hypothetical protein